MLALTVDICSTPPHIYIGTVTSIAKSFHNIKKLGHIIWILWQSNFKHVKFDVMVTVDTEAQLHSHPEKA